MGQIMFYSGVGLMGLAVILAVVFLAKKPVYRPEDAARPEEGSPRQPVKPAASAGGTEDARDVPRGEETLLLTEEERTLLLVSGRGEAPDKTALMPSAGNEAEQQAQKGRRP